MDLLQYPEEVKKLIKKVMDILKIVVEKACKMNITALYVMEDLAMAKGLIISPKMIKEVVLGPVRELVEIANCYEIPVLFHSDGMVMELVDLLIEIGICAVNPLQPHLNDLDEFKNRFGGKMATYGDLDNWYIIPEESPQTIRDHV